jgi:sugar (pentulose or hexulose) kinase
VYSWFRVALIDADGLVLPVMHYEARPPAPIVAAYEMRVPPFTEVYAPVNPGGLTMARQLLWQQTLYPDAFARTRHIVFYAQYWAWRLCGVLATEVTSLGAQTYLWAPRQGDFSTLVDEQGWRGLFPPRRNAWDTLALIHPYISRHTGIAAGTLQRIDPLIIAGFDDYAVRWRERAQTPASS